jgi:hypothetical protein
MLVAHIEYARFGMYVGCTGVRFTDTFDILTFAVLAVWSGVRGSSTILVHGCMVCGECVDTYLGGSLVESDGEPDQGCEFKEVEADIKHMI